MNSLIDNNLQKALARKGNQKTESNPELMAKYKNRSNNEIYYLIRYDPDTGNCKAYVERDDKFKNAWEELNISEWENDVNESGECNVKRDYNFTPMKFSFLDIEHYNEMVHGLSKEDQQKVDEKKAKEELNKEGKELFPRPEEQENDMEIWR